MTIALVLGGAACLHDDIVAANKLFKPDVIVAVKDIGITWPSYDYWATLHPERLPKELGQRRAAGLPDPKAVYSYRSHTGPRGSRSTRGLGIEMRVIALTGGSSGMLGTWAALLHADKVVLAGIPLDPKQMHYSRPKRGGWPAAMLYRKQWTAEHKKFKGRVRSMSGWTSELLGTPSQEWLAPCDSTSSLPLLSPCP